MQRAVKGYEQTMLKRAADEYAAQPGNSITTMMRLALEAVTPAIRERASAWLWKTVGVRVVDEAIGGINATPATAEGLC